MANLGDDILHNILARLSGNPLLRFRCVSKHWNRLISNPYFMKSRSRRMILFPFLQPLVAIDDNVPVEDKAHSIVRIRSPPEYQEGVEVFIVGTFNGIVLLALIHKSFSCHLILYNPLTCASKVLVVIDAPSSQRYSPYVFGFGYGETTHDLKIVRFEHISYELEYKWDVFDLSTSSWSTPRQNMKRDFWFKAHVGVFLNGFLYWATHTRHGDRILVLNVKEMVFSKIKLPDGVKRTWLLLGSIGGCLSIVSDIHDTRYQVWLMKEERDENSWMKAHSFTFDLGSIWFVKFLPVCVLGNGNILMTDRSIRLVIYDVSKDSYKILDGLKTLNYPMRMSDMFNSNGRYINSHFKDIQSIEYVESLISPSDLCFI